MPKRLGILVNTDRHFDYLYGLVKAAYKKDIQTRVFFTGRGVLLTKAVGFTHLIGLAKLSVCEVSFRTNGLEGEVPGVGFKDFATQAVNAEMVAGCDRYLVL